MNKLLVFVLLASLVLAACAPGAETAAPTVAPTQTAVVHTQVVTQVVESTVVVREVVTATPLPATNTPLPTFTSVPTFTSTPSPEAVYDLFDRSLDYCFRTASESVRGYNRVLEFLYGLKVEGDTLIEYSPEERGVDEGTWPSRVILLNATSDRQTLCGEVEARHPILYRMAPEADLQVSWALTMDNVGNESYDAAYEAASVGSNNLGLFIGSEMGVDVAVRIFDEAGNFVNEFFYRVEGEYCSDCYHGTSMVGNQSQYALAPDDFAFETSEREVETTDLVALVLPKDFLGHYEIVTSVEGGHMVDMWLGELNPLSVPATPTSASTNTPIATPTSQ